MDIIISKNEVFNEVEKRSSLEGYVLPDRYDNVWANKDRGELLDSYWAEGYISVVQLLKRYLANQTVQHNLEVYIGDETVTISVNMPERYDSNLDGNIVTDAKMMIACRILQRWLAVTAPEAATKYGEESLSYSVDLAVKISYRKEPTAKLSAASSDGVSIDSTEAALSMPANDTVSLSQGWDRSCVGDCIDCQCENACCREAQ